MALRELPLRAFSAVCRDLRPVVPSLRSSARRNASTDAVQELESSSSLTVPPPSQDVAKGFDPVAQSKARDGKLPSSRYQFKSPKYYRGPLHPHQPPPESDPSSRLFQPGPFSLPPLEQTYQSTIAPDLLALTYVHLPPGFRSPVKEVKGQRLREWTGDSPYYKNRPLRPPRGGGHLSLLTPPRTFRNVPKITKVTVHSMVKEAMENSGYIAVAGMVLQAITNVRSIPHQARHNVTGWGLRSGKTISVTADVEREDAYHFLGKLVNIVLPRIKEWKGVKGSSGDDSGNITFGLEPDQVALFPEVEVNYDSYPPKMIPGCHITIHTSATNDRDARLLLQSIGLPFYGKYIN
ncbi:50S ribosomal subunit L7 [Delitschia confertaspora ATCC 74209]|uniref:Large ribosomal subunit protein uL5m n=1 Tax=Delitschia confertaspora ATCC 74209 TaxID=1513339 RepID=A0A9P4JSX7_9PLEO|nr:50S ribosomal subunit L7 [Delitschia confertaspora ATCC 74209]